jgi:hypothetical protein
MIALTTRLIQTINQWCLQAFSLAAPLRYLHIMECTRVLYTRLFAFSYPDTILQTPYTHLASTSLFHILNATLSRWDTNIRTTDQTFGYSGTDCAQLERLALEID